MRIAALDVGDARIGVAVSDELGITAQGIGVVRRVGGRRDLEALATLLGPYGPERLVVGLPLNMNGSEGPQAARVRAFASRVAEHLNLPVEYWDERVAVNLRHQFFAAQAVVEHMKRRGGGSIINFGSVSWMLKAGGMPAYTTSKAAVHGMSRSLATDLGPFRIRVNTISPGWVMTERQLKLWVTPDGDRRLDENQCLPGRVQPQDIALMALFLAAEDSRMITAQNFIVDAGWV